MGATVFDVLAELFARDLDPELVRRARERTPTERIVWLEEMQALEGELRAARDHEASRAPHSAR